MPTVAIVTRDPNSDLSSSRFMAVAAALRAEGLTPRLLPYDEAGADLFERDLRVCDAALVWVNPVQDGRFRRDLDARLRRAAAAGVLVSAHPDVTDRLGVKAVLARTRAIGWSGDAFHYRTPGELGAGLTSRLRKGPRVLKQNRGNGGIGVWKVSRVDHAHVEVMEAASCAPPKTERLDDFLAARSDELERVDGFVDQAFQSGLKNGMVRCYLSGDRVAGFGRQAVRALLDNRPSPSRTYSGPIDPRFQDLRRRMEDEWVGALMRELDLRPSDLPAIWDADFLSGEDGDGDYVLCEINVSSVHPMPDEAPAAIARTVAVRLADARRRA
jgi:hypothetical protein